jgi:hypothetical protein
MLKKVETSRFYFQNYNQRFLDCARSDREEKNREENKFSSRVEVRVVTPKAFGVVNQAWGVSASFSSLIFSLLLFSSLPSTNSPLSSATRAELCEELGMTSLKRVQLIVTFFLSNILLRNLKIFLRAGTRYFFLVRAKFSFFPRRETRSSLRSHRFPFPKLDRSHRLRP